MKREFTEGIIQMSPEGSKQCNMSCLLLASIGDKLSLQMETKVIRGRSYLVNAPQ